MRNPIGRRATLEGLKIVLPLLLLALLHWNRQAARAWRVSLPTNTYCQDTHDPDLCSADHRAGNFTLLYYDGLPHAFVSLLFDKMEEKSHVFLGKVVHRGISDSVPAFHTYFAGDLPKNYDVSFQNIDSLFRQFELAGKAPRTFVYPKQIQVFAESYQARNVPETRDIAYSLSPHFLEWDLRVARNESHPDTHFPDFQAALRYLDGKIDEMTKEIGPKIPEIHHDLNEYFEKAPNNFVYVPDVDDLSHNRTLVSQRYLDSVASLLANLRVLAEFVLAHRPTTNVFVLSDHGADESRAQQERFNHETPLNTYNNTAFVAMIGAKVDRSAYDEAVEVDSQEVGNLLGLHVQNVNLLWAGRVPLSLFRKQELRKTAIAAAEVVLGKQARAKDTPDSSVETGETQPKRQDKSPLRQSAVRAPSTGSSAAPTPDVSSLGQGFEAGRLGQCCQLLGLLLLLFTGVLFWQRTIDFDVQNRINVDLFCVFVLYCGWKGEFFEFGFAIFFFVWQFAIFVFEYRQTPAPDQYFWLKHLLPLVLAAFWRASLFLEHRLYDSQSIVGLVVSGWVVTVFARRHIPSDRLGTSTRGLVWGHRLIAVVTLAYEALIPIFALPLSHPLLGWVAWFGHGVFGLVALGGLVSVRASFPRTLGCLSLQFVFWTSTAADKLLIFALFEVSAFLFRQAKLRPDSRERLFELLFRTVPLFLSTSLMQGYRFDWKNRIRMAPKLEAAPLYRNAYLLAAVGTLLVAGSKLDALDEANTVVDFTFGLLFALTALIIPHEYRMQAAKLSEALLLCYLPFKAAYFRGLLQRFLDSRRQTLRIHTIVAQKLSHNYRRNIDL